MDKWEIKSVQLTSQYLTLLTPSAYALAKWLSDCIADIAEENWDMGCKWDGKWDTMCTTWAGRSDLDAHSLEIAFT